MNRRTFLKSSALVAGGAFTLPAGAAEGVVASSVPWYRTAYRRNVIDMHIADWNPEFLSKFESAAYVERLRTANVKSAVVYAHSHVGLCYFPTKVGKTHAAYQGKDHLDRTVAGLRKNGIAVVLYMSLIHDTWAYRNHDDWKILRADGAGASEGSRYGICCPNSPYRDYIASLATEVFEQFEFDGIRFDMTFWPRVCYCSHCKKRFADEAGGEPPRIVNWDDPNWVKFQRKREAWLVEFASHMTQTVKKLKPEATVEHQASTFTANFRLGVTEPLAAQNDFLQGDFYGDAVQGSLIRKLFYNLSPNQPYAFETSVMLTLQNHTALKPESLLEAKASACIADGGAFVFIDAIDPAGTIHAAPYEAMDRVFEKTNPYEAHLGGELVQDVAVYLSTESKFDPAQNGKDVEDYSAEGMPHIDALLGACRALRANHIPYGVITKKDLARLDRHKVLVLPNVLMMDEEEVAAIRAWVNNGGALYASRETSLAGKDGTRYTDFLLSDVLGVSMTGVTAERVTYMAPVVKDIFGPYTAASPLMVGATQRTIRAHENAEVLATVVLPYSNPDDAEQFASIHSNPPGVPTENPCVVFHKSDKGTAIYAADAIEAYEYCEATFIRLLRRLGQKFSIEADGPACVEITTFHQPERNRFVIGAVNFQRDLPNIPVDGVRVRLDLNGRALSGVELLPKGEVIEVSGRDGRVEIPLPRIETLCMVAVKYG
ncbi:MAG: beta-galactosidase trimerization domain-containing protein [Candidatus Hydrogenedentes bacterium]|nr:beta-galactosidase trimerization domain-containing protein [Candidatus Hydrogenedentota bacterium]